MFKKFFCFLALTAQFFLFSDEPGLQLKQRQPNWRLEVIESYPEGGPKKVVFFEQASCDREAPVKVMEFYSNGQIKTETDVIESGKEYVPHGVSLFALPNGQIEQFSPYDHGLLHGDLKLFYPDGKVKGLCSYQKGMRHGPVIAYHENGEKKEEGRFEEGVLVGEMIRYNDKGARIALIPHRSGLPHGEVIEWFDSGSLQSTRRFIDGVLSGDGIQPAVVIYGEDKEILEVQDFRAGLPIGLHVKYHKNGKESYRVNYQEGKKVGKEQLFDEAGILIGGGNYANGVAVGEHRRKHENDKIAFLAKYDEKGLLLEPIVEWTKQGAKLKEYSIIDSKLHGSYKEWYEDGSLKVSYNYNHDGFDGEQIEYHPNKQMKARGLFTAGKRDGKLQEWYANGRLALEVNFKEGLRHGETRKFFPSGQPALVEYFEEDQLDNERKEWFENKTLRTSGAFAKGKKEGIHREWNEKGDLLFEGKFATEIPDGFFKTWYRKNTPKEIIFYKEGKKHGKTQEFFENGKMKCEASYEEDLLDGLVQLCDESGMVLSQRNYSRGKQVGQQKEYYPLDVAKKDSLARVFHYDDQGELHGEQKSWYPGGQLQSVAHYEHGQLHGKKQIYAETEELIEEADFQNGKLHGRHFQRFPEGREVVHHYKANRLEGLHEVFYSATEDKEKQCALKALYVDGELEDEVLEYSPEGELVASTMFVHGKKEGPAKVWDPQGRLVATAEFIQDKRHGKQLQFFPNGNVYKESTYRNDLLQKEEITYHLNGKIAAIVPYDAGTVDGLSRDWNNQGVLIFEGEFKEGKRVGKFNKYYDNGKPKLLQIFVNDQLHGVKKSYDENGKITEARYEHGKKIN